MTKKQEEYISYQENLAFEKELHILRNDFYYQLLDSKDITLVDFMYQPLDVMSGDAYTARRVSKHKTFYLIVDGMGKGISASLTSMIMTTFINHSIDKMVAQNDFALDRLIQEALDFIKPILLDQEVLSIDFICFDAYFHKLHYAKFSMPPFLLLDNKKRVIKLKSNNPPLSKWQKDYVIDTFDVADVDKFLFYSDGIVENKTKDGSLYALHMAKDFRNSFTKEEFREKLFSKLAEPEDDFTLIFLNKLSLNKRTLLEDKYFDAKLESVDEANEWYAKLLESLSEESKFQAKTGLVFNELFMNAYEHGSLGIDSTQKHKMLEDDTYFDTLLDLESRCDKRIRVQIFKLQYETSHYIVTEITDEGEGFDTLNLTHVFRNSRQFNGRGVIVSRKNSMGIYYNEKGNCVLFLSKF